MSAFEGCPFHCSHNQFWPALKCYYAVSQMTIEAKERISQLVSAVVKCSIQYNTSLTSQTHFHKKGKSLVNYVYKLCPATTYGAVPSRYSILSHDTLHHRLSSNNGLKNSDRQLGHLFYFKSALFEMWLRLVANCIPVGHGLHTQFTRSFPFLQNIIHTQRNRWFSWGVASILKSKSEVCIRCAVV